MLFVYVICTGVMAASHFSTPVLHATLQQAQHHEYIYVPIYPASLPERAYFVCVYFLDAASQDIYLTLAHDAQNVSRLIRMIRRIDQGWSRLAAQSRKRQLIR